MASVDEIRQAGQAVRGVDAWRPSKKDLQIVAYAYADLGNEKDNRRSVTGFVLQMEGCTYAYSSHK